MEGLARTSRRPPGSPHLAKRRRTAQGWGAHRRAAKQRDVRPVPIENKYVVIAAVVAFLLVLWLSHGRLFVAFGALALICGIGWAVRRLSGPR
jgi:hypothetical protein